MPQIPSDINGVQVEFGSGVDRDVASTMIDALTHAIRPGVAKGNHLARIYVSSAHDSHVMPSRHMQRKAVDISRINGVKIALGYPGNAGLMAIVNAIQDEFEKAPHRRENFGPHLKHKSGAPFAVSGHHDHIHLSVD